MGYSVVEKLRDNIRAIRVMLDTGDTEQLAKYQVAALKGFSGFGGIKAALYGDGSRSEWVSLGATENDLRLYEPMQELYSMLRENFSKEEYSQVITALKNSLLSAFYTPAVLPQTLFEVLAKQEIIPKRIYEPSAGAGVFLEHALRTFPMAEQITAVEKDLLTGGILHSIYKNHESVQVRIGGFEQSPAAENGTYNLIVGNIPFGNYQVYDPLVKEDELKGRIHNYFFGKALDKLSEGGLVAFVTTDAFLNTPGNQLTREYIFQRADFISLVVLPDNLMKDTGNTEAPCHLLVLQKNSAKEGLSELERLLTESEKVAGEQGHYYRNKYILKFPDIIVGNQISEGTNQYGSASQKVWFQGDINGIGSPVAKILNDDLRFRFRKDLFYSLQTNPAEEVEKTEAHKKLTCLEPPKHKVEIVASQLGLFDSIPIEQANRASAYLSPKDLDTINGASARIISMIRTSENPGHEGICLIAAKQHRSGRYLYKLFSNYQEIGHLPEIWMTPGGLGAALNNVSSRLEKFDHHYLYEGDQTYKRLFRFEPERIIYPDPKAFHQKDMLVYFQDEIGVLNALDGQRFYFMPLQSQLNKALLVDYIDLRDSYLEFTAASAHGGNSDEALREVMEKRYDDFVGRHGQLNLKDNWKVILTDTLHGALMVGSLERRQGEGYVKADVVTGQLQADAGPHQTSDPAEALAISLNKFGRVDLSYIAGVIGQDAQSTIIGLGNLIYLNPITDNWETADDFLSGNVVLKMKQIGKKMEEYPDLMQYQRSLAAIESVQPQIIPFELLDFNLGERWIPIEYYSRFAAGFFELEVKVHYFPSQDTFKVICGSNSKVDTEYSVTTKSGTVTRGRALMEHALENTSPHYTYEVKLLNGGTIRRPDNEAIQLAHQKIEQIRTAFVNWLTELPEQEKRTLETLYNETFNCYVLREYNGDHLKFPGLDKQALGITELYSSQRKAVWRIVQNGGAIIDHEVGLGKTLTMICASQEMKRLGIKNKPVILALKANVEQIADTFKKAYPAARLLYPGEEDFTPANRVRIFLEIKNNNWDCIILTHDQFGKIPQSYQIQREICEIELENVQKDLDTVKAEGGQISKAMLKGLQIRMNNLSGKLSTIIHNINEKKDQGITFEEMGLDHLLVDESHKFKNLTFTTRHARVAGIGNMEGSQKALNLLFALRTLQHRFGTDLCATFLSGTPISNSLTEMYLLFKYLRPNEMKRQHIENFDGWAAVFAKKTTDFEFSVTNEIIARERFRHFIKVPELALFYNGITDYKTAKHIGLDKPEIDQVLINIKPTPEQSTFIRKLMEFARTANGELIGHGRLSDKEKKAIMLIATNYAKKMAVDMRLINPSRYQDHPENKVSHCARKIVEHYHSSMAHRGTQLVFCDIGTPRKDEFNIYDALKEKLVKEYNIPAQEITFIHDWTEKRKPELFKKMNAGIIRITLGSTEKLGTGNNVQRRIVATHDLDIPWKPSELDQRNGRGARQGNEVAKKYYGNKVKNYVYAVEQSLDNYKFNLLKNKQTFISQMKNCTLSVRTIDEGAMDENGGMNYSEYIAILSGDQSLLAKSKLEKRIAVTESLKLAHFREVHRARSEFKNKNEEHAKVSRLLERLSSDVSYYQKELCREKDGTKLNPIKLRGCHTLEAERIGNHLIQIHKNWTPAPSVESSHLGSLYGFDLYVYRDWYRDASFHLQPINRMFAQRGEEGVKYTYNNGMPNCDNPKLAARYFLEAIDRCVALEQKYHNEQQALAQDLPRLEKLCRREFPQEHELQAMKAELSGLEREIAVKIQDTQMQGVAYGSTEVINSEQGSFQSALGSNLAESSEGNYPAEQARTKNNRIQI